MDDLSAIANKYESDKGTIAPSFGHHGPRLHFTTVYSDYFKSLRNEKLVFLEIGVGGGPSLKMWYEYFPNAEIHAIDILDQTKHDNDRTKTYVCDQSDRDQLNHIMRQVGLADIIIDDGSHVVSHQQISLGCLFPHLKKGGQYWIEDLHTSDRSVWQGKFLYGNDMSINENESTVEVLENYLSNLKMNSPFLTASENQYLTDNISKCTVYDLPKTFWGLNKLALLQKK